jgi:hypothetical protein
MNQRDQKLTIARRERKVKQRSLFFMIGGVVLLALAFFIWQSQNKAKVPVEVSGGPSLSVDKEQVDLGDVRLGQTVQVSFEVANVGDQTLHFDEAPYIEVVEGC